MAKYRVYLTANASATVHVEIDPVQYENGEIDEDLTDERAIERAYKVFEGNQVCAQCSGWNEKWSLDLSEFEPEDDGPVKAED